MNRNPAYQGYEIGDYSYGYPTIVRFEERTRLRIGRFCSIADNVKILLGGEHRTDWISTYPFSIFFPGWAPTEGHPASKGDIVIGNDVWICYGTMLLSGVTVGDGAVLGAGSVVTQKVPPYAIVAGNPAKVIRYRFPPDVINELLEVAWWNWPIERIQQESKFLLSGSTEEFLRRARTASAENVAALGCGT